MAPPLPSSNSSRAPRPSTIEESGDIEPQLRKEESQREAAGRRIALLLEYDGSRYGGSQLQKNAPTIQDELEKALIKLTGERPRVAFAGRTDAGVHARGQVASFLTGSTHPTDVFERGLNRWLPVDIAVRRARETALGFDPRRQARRRTYRYLVYNDRSQSPLLRGRAWHVAEPLDVEAMARAAALLVGKRDFAAFAESASTAGSSTIREMYRCEVRRRREVVAVLMEANAFLPHQVRRTVGPLVEVGRGRLTVDGFAALIREAEPGAAGPVAPAQGLCLMRVTYDDLDFGEEIETDEDIQC